MYSPRLSRKPYASIVLLLTPFAAGATQVTTTPLDAVQQAKELVNRNRFDEATTVLERGRTLAAIEKMPFAEGVILDDLGLIYEKQAKYLEAQTAFDGSISLLARVRGENAPELVQPLNNLSHLLYESGENARAEALVRRSLAIQNANGKADADTGAEWGILGKICLRENKYAEAKDAAENSLAILRRVSGTEGPAGALAYSVLGAVYSAYHEPAGAEDSFKRALAILRHALAADDYRIGEAVANLGLLYIGEGESGKAEPLLEEAHDFFRRNGLNTLFSRQFLISWAALERQSGHKKKAKELEKEAKVLNAASPEATFSRYVVDASSFR